MVLNQHCYYALRTHRVTRLFCGNLNKKVTEEELKQRLQGITYIKWITDKQTGEFYGSSFLEMKDPASAALAVLQDKSKFLGRYALYASIVVILYVAPALPCLWSIVWSKLIEPYTLFTHRPLKLYYCPPKPGDKWPPHPIGSNMGNPNDNPDSSSAHTLHKGNLLFHDWYRRSERVGLHVWTTCLSVAVLFPLFDFEYIQQSY